MKRQYLTTERAHFMCPNMHFGMIIELEKPYNKLKIEETLTALAVAHPFLRARISYEEGTTKLFYDIKEDSQIQLNVRENEATLWDDYKAISAHDWNVFENGLLKVFIYPKNDSDKSGIKVLLVAHHLLVDGRGILQLAEEFADCYVEGKKPSYAEERLLETINDLPPKSELPFISRVIVKRANSQWKKENHTVSYEYYKEFVEKYSKTHHVEYQTYSVDETELAEMLKVCKDNGFTMNDLLMAHMYLKANIKKIIIAADIRKLFPSYNPGALGNYATAMGIEIKTKTTDLIEKAKEVHNAVQKHMAKNSALMLVLACYFEMNATLLDAAAISALGAFESKAGYFVGGTMFGFAQPKSYSITNLGHVENKNALSLMFIPPASPAAKLTLGVVTCNGKMKACSSKN